ncbi:hypothetical protein [uncultured Photobacterium sp.]|uniref:hypothetical protein n=1 Tax=uncultured Photobacterium sp. TaxID=173973 RepID=UPI00261A552D|nr:hypothetical protein [uncultured Photobacterium sp.]
MNNLSNIAELAAFCVDSGQFVITGSQGLAKLVSDTGEFKDKRKPMHVDGREIDKKYLRNWQAPAIDELSLNELEDQGLLDMQLLPLCEELSLQGACDTTLYKPNGAGIIENSVASCTHYGDGRFTVLGNENSLMVYTGFVQDFNLNGKLEQIGVMDVDGPVYVIDPCYRNAQFGAEIKSLEHGVYGVYLYTCGDVQTHNGIVLTK